MMKKVLYGVALALAACGPVCTLQSCKDDVSDLKTQTSFDLAELRKDLNDQAAKLQLQIKANEQAILQNKGTIQALVNSLDQYAKVWYVDQRLSDLMQAIAPQLDYLHDGINDINGRLDKLELTASQIEGLKATDQALLALIIDNASKINGLEGKYDALKKVTDKHADAIENLKFRVTEAVKAINLINEELDKLKPRVDALEGDVDQIKKDIAYMQENLAALNETVSALRQDVYELNGRVEDLEERMDNAEKRLDDLTGEMQNLVTGILIQGVNSPVFGDLHTPLGVKSNILFNWFGYNKTGGEIDFPSSVKGISATGDPAVDFSGAKTDKIEDGYYPANVELGTVYVTLNPLNHQFSDLSVQIVNSVGEPLPFKISLDPSKKVLTHGFSRAEDTSVIDSYLYEGKAILSTDKEDELNSVRISLDDKLESAMKDALKDPNKRTAASLVKALYNQFNGLLPAYGLEYNWEVAYTYPEVSTKSYSVLSNYDLAVATAHPLGFNFLKTDDGKDFTDKHLPIIGQIDNIISSLKGKIKIEIPELKEGDLSINLGEIEVSTDNVNLLMVIPMTAVEGEGLGITSTSYDLVLSSKVPNKPYETMTDAEKKAFLEEILKKEIGNVADYDYQTITGLGDIGTSIEQSLASSSTKISNQLVNQINDNLIGKINEQINTQIEDVINDFENKLDPYFDKANKAFDLYNKVAEKVNRFLKNPNAYLQVTALYDMGNGEVGFVSGNPTDFTQYNGNGSFNIYLTSYTGELIVPAYKKYVAVTGVSTDNGKSFTKVSVNAAPNTGELNTVLPGNRIRVNVPVAGFTSGNVYEFTYQAIDYRGYTSTRKFYVKIVK